MIFVLLGVVKPRGYLRCACCTPASLADGRLRGLPCPAPTPGGAVRLAARRAIVTVRLRCDEEGSDSV